MRMEEAKICASIVTRGDPQSRTTSLKDKCLICIMFVWTPDPYDLGTLGKCTYSHNYKRYILKGQNFLPKTPRQTLTLGS